MFQRSDLADLLESEPQLAVSIFLPTHRFGPETRQDPQRLKKLIGEALQKLQAAGMGTAQAQDLLAPAAALVDEYDFWQHQDEALALFLGAGEMRMYKLPIPTAEQVRVGPHFHVRPLLPLLAADGAFLVLTISADHTRLFQASRFSISEDEATGLPRNLDEVKGEPDYENPLQASPIGRPRTGSLDVSKAQVQGESPEEWRKGRLVEYVRRVALALRDRLASNPTPVVLAADAEIGGHFQKVAALGPMLAGTIEINPAALDATQLHRQAYAVMQPRLDQARKDEVERFAALGGAGDARAARLLEDVARAAYEGRVGTLFVAEGQSVWRRFDESTRRLSQQEDKGMGEQDLLDAIAARTLSQGGSVFVLPENDMPDGLPAVAILRY
jgi:hypothetical protein